LTETKFKSVGFNLSPYTENLHDLVSPDRFTMERKSFWYHHRGRLRGSQVRDKHSREGKILWPLTESNLDPWLPTR